VILYGDKVTRSMQICIDEVNRRRELQAEFNKREGITPQTIIKPVREGIEAMYEMDYTSVAGEIGGASQVAEDAPETWQPARLRAEIERTRADMLRAAAELEFEQAARLRDTLNDLEALELRR
jgi:excinuclease ABC subunit B